MCRNRLLTLLFLTLVASCSSDLPHESPFDADSPLVKQAKASLTGEIRLEGETDFAGVSVRVANRDRVYDFTTANDGKIELPGIVPGDYTLTVSTRYFKAAERELTFTLGEQKALDTVVLELNTAAVSGSALARAIRDDAEVLQGGVLIKLTKIASIRQGAGAAPSNVRTAAAPETEATTYTTTSNGDGSYSFDEVEAGEYEITASNDEVPAQAQGTITVTGEGNVTAEDVLLQPLAGFFTIRGTGASGPSELYTGVPTVQLQLTALGAERAKIGSSASGSAGGCSFPNPAVNLDGNLTPAYVIPAPGLHTVCVRFVDAGGAETETLLGSIIYDNQAPKLASAVINDGAPASGSLSVGVRFSAVETETTLHAYQIANTSSVDWNAAPKFAYQPNILHTLAGDGLQTVFARFQDAAGNWTDIVSASIEVSTQAPTGSATLRDENGTVVAAGQTTRSSRVYVTSSMVSQTSLQMQVTTNGSYAGIGWEPYAAMKAVDLPPQATHEKALRAVKARVRDAVGRVVDLLDTNFYLDARGPTGSVSAPALVNSFDIPLSFAVNDPGAVVEIAENPSFVGSVSFPYQAANTYTLVNQTDGLRTLYVRFIDEAGNSSALASAVVQVDTTPPQLAAFSIRQGELTRTRTIDLDLTALDAIEVSVTEAASCSDSWVPFTATRQHTFAADTDGDKTIAVKYRDGALNETACLTKTISYDKTPPVPGLFQINGGAQYARERAVTLSISVAGATEMQIAETAVFSGAWQPVTTTANYTLSAGEGAKTLYLQFRDLAGNLAQAAPASIQLDTVAPEQPLVTVNDGSGYARQLTAALTLSATGSPSHYRWTVDGIIDNKPWLPFTTSTSVSLGAGADGARVVAVQFQDAAGNVSLTAQANVVLDREAPSAPSIRIDDGAPTTRDAAGLVTLTLNAGDTGSGLEKVRIAPTEGGLASAPALSFEPTKLYTLDNYTADGIKPVWVSFYDKAGNYSTPVSAVIKLDRIANAPVLSLPAGSLTSSGIVPITVAADADAVEMQVSHSPGLPGAAWQPYTETLTYTFPAVEGPATLFVRVRDDAGNESAAAAVGVVLDLTPPVLGGVSGAVISDTLVWDDYNPDTVGYTVYLFDQGAVKSVTHTTEKRLHVGQMNPGFTVVAKYADGTTSAFSQPPGFAVPPTMAGFIGLRAGSRDNALLARLAQEYGLGATTSGCAQVIFTDQWESSAGAPAAGPGGAPGGNGDGTTGGSGTATVGCAGSNAIRLLGDRWSQSPPPFEAAIEPVAGNPFAGLPALRISGGGRSYYYSSGGNPHTPLLTVPGWLKWQGSSYPAAETGDVVASIAAYNPAAGDGENEIRVYFPLAAMAVTDDVSYSFTPMTVNPVAYGYLGNQPLALVANGRFAGLDVTRADFRNRYYEGTLAFNGLGESLNNYSAASPGAIRLPMYATEGTAVGQTISVSSLWSYCSWEWDPGFGTWEYMCSDYGQSASVDLAASTLTLTDYNPHWDDSWNEFTVSNADGSRFYRLPFPVDGMTTVYWKNEYDQAAIEGYLRAMIRQMATPVRVRGTGIPVLTHAVSGATEMMIGLDAAFTDAQWQAYAAEVTLPEGTTTVWVRYRDDAGNVTASQPVPIAAPEQAPRVDEAVILGEAGNPGYTTGENVTAYLLGIFPSDIAVRVSTSPVFEDSGWIDVGSPLDELEFTDPLTGEKDKPDLDGYQVVPVPLTIPAAPGTYTYYFWARDASQNFSRMAQASVLFDTTVPEAEFSLKPGGPGEVLMQAQWTVTKSPILPSLASLSPTPVTQFALPFSVPFLDTASNQLQVDPDRACLHVGYLSACAMEKLTNIADHSVTVNQQQAVVVWRGAGPYGTEVTTAATVASDGSVRLSYWNTGARISMFGQVDLVETPYADMEYAAILGSVEYLPNELPLQFLLRSHTGKIEKVSVRARQIQSHGGGYWTVQSPWRPIQVEDRGVVRYTGTAYSLAGAAGRTSKRDVYVRGGDWDDNMLDKVSSVALTDTRRWLTWDLGDDHYTTAFRVAGVHAGFGTVAGGLDNARTAVSETHQFVSVPYDRGQTQWALSNQNGRSVEHFYGPALVAVDDGSIPAAGAPVTPDFASRMLFGADGSLWDLSDPRRPAPIRTYAGSYPYYNGRAAKVGNYVWTGAGIFDVSSPETPVRVAATQHPESSFVAFAGKVYEIFQWQYWSYEASYPVSAPTNGWFNTYTAGNEVHLTGGKLLSANGDLIGIDLTLPTPDSFYAGWVGHAHGYVDADARGGHWGAVAAAGFLRYHGVNGAVVPRFRDEGTPYGVPLLWDVRRLISDGPWVFGTAADALHIGHVGRALPDRVRRVYTQAIGSSNPSATVDNHYLYICDNATLSLYSLEGVLQKSATVKGCGEKILAAYPYVTVGGGYRYRIDGSSITYAPLSFCDPFGSSAYCPEGSLIGTAWRDYSRKVWIGEDLLVPLSDPDCEPMGITDSLVLCYDWSTGDIKGAPFSALRYRGVVTGPSSLPLARLLNDGSQVVDARGEYFSTNVGTYFVKGLQSVLLIGPGNLKFVAPGFASDADGNLYALEAGTMRRVANVSTSGIVHPSPGGLLATAYGTNVWTTKWGPGLPEYRLTMPNSAQARDIVASAGYVYMATPAGLARTDGLMGVAMAEPRNDVTVRHTGNAWTLLGPDRRPVTTVVEAAPGNMIDLCDSLLFHHYTDPDQPWNPPADRVCNWSENVTTGTVFQGDLGGLWLGLRGVSLDAVGDVSSLAVDTAGRVYAGVQASSGGTGVYMYDPADTALAAVDFLPTGPVLDVAVTHDTLYVLQDNGDLIAYDMRNGYAVKWTQPGTSYRGVVATPGAVAAADSGWEPRVLDPATGNVTGWCSGFNGKFEFSTRRWGGALHPVLIGPSGFTVQVIDAQTCAWVESLQVDAATDIQFLRRQGGFLLLGDVTGELYITPENEFSRPHVFTVLQGPQAINQAVMVGPFVYTIGSGAGQIFQLH